jgi:hypothetical protein
MILGASQRLFSGKLDFHEAMAKLNDYRLMTEPVLRQEPIFKAAPQGDSSDDSDSAAERNASLVVSAQKSFGVP